MLRKRNSKNELIETKFKVSCCEDKVANAIQHIKNASISKVSSSLSKVMQLLGFTIRLFLQSYFPDALR